MDAEVNLGHGGLVEATENRNTERRRHRRTKVIVAMSGIAIGVLGGSALEVDENNRVRALADGERECLNIVEASDGNPVFLSNLSPDESRDCAFSRLATETGMIDVDEEGNESEDLTPNGSGVVDILVSLPDEDELKAFIEAHSVDAAHFNSISSILGGMSGGAVAALFGLAIADYASYRSKKRK